MNNPFARLPKADSFEVTSEQIAEGERLKSAQLSAIFGVEGGKDESPQLSWSGFPENTKSFAITCFDPDAPTQSGFWHWSVVNIPATTTEIAAGAGDIEGSSLPPGAFQLRNDAGIKRFVGAAPPKGHGEHRYFFVVHALDVEDLGVNQEATPAYLNFVISGHILARAVIVATYEM
ncbi:MAG: YbhB/YbcL family Raf kinase inhibitor-like protein [Bacteroidales bacterium]